MSTLSKQEKIAVCVLCGKDTPYMNTTHIDNRYHYVEGAGQLCSGCHKESYMLGYIRG